MLVYGFINSLILALVALGFSITFGISRVANVRRQRKWESGLGVFSRELVALRLDRS